MTGATHSCRRCGQPDRIPDAIYDTSDSLRFDPAVRLCLECWTLAKAEFDVAMARADEQMKPLRDALDASTRLTAEDFNITINTRE